MRPLLFSLAFALATPCAAQNIGERQAFTQGHWIAYNAPWSTYSGAGLALKAGVDYADVTAINTTAFPNDLTFVWHWPLTPSKNAGVYGYDFVSFGNYNGGHPPEAVTPERVAQIQTLSLHFSLAYLNRIGSYNILAETFLTSAADDANAKMIEIGFLPHAAQGSYSWIAAGRQLGAFTDASGRSWIAVQHAGPTGTYPYVTFSSPSHADVPIGTLDFLGAIRFLGTKGLVQAGWWFNGLAIGVEPVTGSGWVMAKALAVDYR